MHMNISQRDMNMRLMTQQHLELPYAIKHTDQPNAFIVKSEQRYAGKESKRK